MVKSLVIWGAKGHARVLDEFIDSQQLKLEAIFDNDPTACTPFPNVPLFIGQAGFIEWKHSNPRVSAVGMVAIGGHRGRARLEIQRFLSTHGVNPVTAIHPTAYVARNAILGSGCQILANSTVCADTQLGEGCIVNTAASVDHECVVGDGVHLAPGARIAGEVRIGSYTMIAIGANVLPGVRIGSNCIIGAASLVTDDVPDNTIYYGTPARFVRNNLFFKDLQ